ncbi:hypothetical protein V8G54_002401 [Vigna mungo]|uniref:Uncharacterized protein n=1 Tax=Vigna mungo TaxID=3915 RepID=A0AAQ3PB97_VIGMU
MKISVDSVERNREVVTLLAWMLSSEKLLVDHGRGRKQGQLEKKMEVVFTSSFLDNSRATVDISGGFWNLRATVEMICYKSRSLPRLRCPARLIAASQLRNPVEGSVDCEFWLLQISESR